MTAIVGIVHNGRVWLGADTAVTAGDFVVGETVKVWEQGEFVFAFTGSVREQQIVQHRVVLPDVAEATTIGCSCFTATTP